MHMYIPPFNKQDNPEELYRFMTAHNFISLVTSENGELIASHIPVMIERQEDDFVISGHLARANSQVEAFGKGQALAIFSGPHAYISPTHYETVESVPTWNYSVVHAYGVPRAFSAKDDPERIEAMLMELVRGHEASYEKQWHELSDKFKQGMMMGIVGFTMKVERLEGKYKLSQNKSQTEQKNIARALSQSRDSAIAETGQMMGLELEI